MEGRPQSTAMNDQFYPLRFSADTYLSAYCAQGAESGAGDASGAKHNSDCF